MDGPIYSVGFPNGAHTGTRLAADAHQAPPRVRAVELDRHIGRRLRFLRRLSGCSQREIGTRMGMTFQQMQKYENGVNRVSAALLAELAGMFHLTLDWFIGPYGSRAARPGVLTRADCYETLLEMMFQHDHHYGDADGGAMLATLCQLIRVADLPPFRLTALRHAISAATEADRAFLIEAGRRIMEQARGAPHLPDNIRNDPRGGEGGYVLLVDDDPDITTTLAASLMAAGFTVTTADGGEAALAVLAAGALPDVLVTDIAMVGMDGVELLNQAALLHPTLPGMVITGFAESDRLQELPESVEVLRKPFRRMELVGRLRLLLGRMQPLNAMNPSYPRS